jgi:hypothetical protein
MKVQTKQTLANRQCNTPGCDCDKGLLYFHATCHGDSLKVVYHKERGHLFLYCAECENPVASIQVGNEWDKHGIVGNA